MDNNFIRQLKKRIEGNRRMLNESLQMFRATIGIKKSGHDDSHDTGSYPSSIKVKPIRLPDRQIGLKELVLVMVRQISYKDVIYIVAISLGIIVIGLLTPTVTYLIFGYMIPYSDRSLLIPLGVLLLNATIGSALLTMSRALLLQRVRDKMNCALQASLMDRMFRLPVHFFRLFPAGKLGERLMEVSRVAYDLSYKIMGALISLIFAAFFFLQIQLIAPDLLNLSIFSTLVQISLMVFFFIFASKEQLRVRKAGAELFGMLYNIIKGIPKIKIYAAEDRIFSRWAQSYLETLVDRAGRNRFLVLYPALTAFVTLGTTVLTYKYSIQYKLPVADYISYISSYGMVLAAISGLSSLLPELTSIQPAIKLCEPLLNTVPEEKKEYDTVTKLSGNIIISNLSFRYPDQTTLSLDDFSLKVNPGEYLGIVGPSGCGKSTLIRLLLGFEMSESGSIFFDHHPIDNVDLQSLRRRMGTVLQNSRLFEGTIYNNIVITNPTATLDEVWEAIRLACLEDEIKALPMGLHTHLGDGGGGLSGGQCQRLLLARTLVGKPDILILDEATSALDNITQAEVIKNLDSLKCTRICVAHRLSTVRNCSRIIVLYNGKIMEEGTFESLMEQRGIFYELAKRQL